MRRRFAILTTVVLLPLGCESKTADDGMTPPPAAATVQVSPTSAPLTPTTTQQFTATAADASGNPVTTTFAWSSTAATIANVSATGLASGVAAGTAQIRATAANGVFGQATVTVTVPAPPAVVASVQVIPSIAALTPTTTQQFSGVARDAAGNTVSTALTWTSSAAFIATVSASGLAAGVSAGSAQIRATASNGVFGEATASVTAPPPPSDFRVATSQSVSGLSRNPTATVQVPVGHKVIGCGALTDFDANLPGIMLTAVYPSDARTCTATAKDHIQVSEGTVQVWAIAVVDLNNEWDVSITSQSQPGNTATATLPAGYALTGGGGRITSTGAGVLMTSTRPSGNTWVIAGKDHIQPDATATTISYVIGLRPRNGAAAPTSTVTFQQMTALEARVAGASGTTLVGGGATIAWNGPGRMLRGSYPAIASWVALGKEHLLADVGTVTAYAIGIRVP